MQLSRAALIICALSGATALRLTPAKNATVASTPAATVAATNVTAGNDTSAALDAAMAAAQAMIGAHSKPSKANAAPTNSSSSSGGQQRAKIDLGFTEFEKKLEEQLTSGCHNATQGDPAWTPELQQQLVANVTGEFSIVLKKALAPIKKSIGKTWVALPYVEQQDGYVVKLRTGFVSTLDSNVDKMVKHLQLGFNHVARVSKNKGHKSPAELLSESEQTINDNLLADHCYGDESFMQLDEAPKKEVKLLKHFCIQSVVGSMVKHLNATEGLISMTMRFDSSAMLSLVQEPVVT